MVRTKGERKRKNKLRRPLAPHEERVCACQLRHHSEKMISRVRDAFDVKGWRKLPRLLSGPSVDLDLDIFSQGYAIYYRTPFVEGIPADSSRWSAWRRAKARALKAASALW
jgi:hypothetical protein